MINNALCRVSSSASNLCKSTAAATVAVALYLGYKIKETPPTDPPTFRGNGRLNKELKNYFSMERHSGQIHRINVRELPRYTGYKYTDATDTAKKKQFLYKDSALPRMLKNAIATLPPAIRESVVIEKKDIILRSKKVDDIILRSTCEIKINGKVYDSVKSDFQKNGAEYEAEACQQTEDALLAKIVAKLSLLTVIMDCPPEHLQDRIHITKTNKDEYSIMLDGKPYSAEKSLAETIQLLMDLRDDGPNLV